ncbi:hypothetical protein [Porcipelethomonas sp.]|uniref:hypothetical protein n=1 Tax=Porcipelethomonas sp. TaxID=2981675 RepID=UPI003EF0ACEA
MILLTPGDKPTGIQYSTEMRVHESETAETVCEVPDDSEDESTVQTEDTCEDSAEDEVYDDVQTETEVTEEITEEEHEETSEDYAKTSMFDDGFDSSFKAYMDYRCITDTSSVQYEMQQQAYTDYRGFRRIGDDYCVALGTGITGGCGERFMIYLDSGYCFSAVVADVKSDLHTDATCCYVPRGDNSGNVVEFIIDSDYADYNMLSSGNAGYYEDLSGNIVSIEPI